MKLFSFLFLFISFSVLSKDRPTSGVLNAKYNLWEDSKHTLRLFGIGAYRQFTQKNNLYYLTAAAPSLYWAFEEDDRIRENMLNKKMKKPVEVFGTLGVVFNFPLIPVASWYYAKNKQ